MKKYILPFLLLILAASASSAKAETLETILNLEAAGEIEVVPDLADFKVSLSCVDEDVNTSNDCLKSEATLVYKVLGKLQIDKKDYHSSRVNLNKSYHWENGKKIFKGYRASMTISIIIRDLDKLDDALGRLMTLKNLSLSGLSYSHSNMEKLKIEAYMKALDNADNLAESIKNKIGGRSMHLMEINQLSRSVRPMGAMAEAKVLRQTAADEPLNINIGTLVFRENISVRYKIIKE